jgi:hypothetical protein
MQKWNSHPKCQKKGMAFIQESFGHGYAKIYVRIIFEPFLPKTQI